MQFIKITVKSPKALRVSARVFGINIRGGWVFDESVISLIRIMYIYIYIKYESTTLPKQLWKRREKFFRIAKNFEHRYTQIYTDAQYSRTAAKTIVEARKKFRNDGQP